MRYGVTMFATDQTMAVPELAVEAEARDFDSIYLPEHTHIPVSRRTPPPTGQAELPEEYRRTVDPLVALAAAATLTETIRLGTGILLMAQREPIVTAKAIATLDAISGGRCTLGIGFGWNEDELADHGVAMADRREVCRERVLAMQSLWADDIGGFDGTHVHVSESWSWPKPVQASHGLGPPVLLGGGAGPKLFAHIIEYGDGWIPIGGSGLGDNIPKLRSAAVDAGRDPSELQIVSFGSLPDAAKLEYFAGIGVTECVMPLPSGSRDTVLPALDQWADLVHRA